ncbi:hypothetical protein [Streptomyces radicis]|uniref:Uncharacterized protein n=1 Tax=Streptomyces radicis TaxID=1750517 RepID=A0A3A9W183_9ACTN|nr:hypothetical protein [Streptomyces radicis]RKN06985.1 hypothetical protein D7319_20005 [Streptomyces radicis]RKN15875.1 hypothetical protein D7318_26790 [Streptomyces radicis]
MTDHAEYAQPAQGASSLDKPVAPGADSQPLPGRRPRRGPLLLWSPVLALVLSGALAAAVVFSGASPVMAGLLALALEGVCFAAFGLLGHARVAWAPIDPDPDTGPRLHAQQGRQFAERLGQLVDEGGDQAVIAVLEQARAAAAELTERATEVTGLLATAGAHTVERLRGHEGELEREIADLPSGPLKSARAAALRETRAWRAYRERWEEVETPLLGSVALAAERLLHVQREGARLLKRQRGGKGDAPDATRLTAELATAREALARAGELVEGFPPGPARTYQPQRRLALTGLLSAAVLLGGLAVVAGEWNIFVALALIPAVGFLAGLGDGRRALVPGVAALVAAVTLVLAGPLVHQQVLGERREAEVSMTVRVQVARWSETTHYDLVDADTGEDLGRMATGPHEAVPGRTVIEVATDPLGWARPVAVERMDLAPVWAAVAGAGLAVALVGLALPERARRPRPVATR